MFNIRGVEMKRIIGIGGVAILLFFFSASVLASTYHRGQVFCKGKFTYRECTYVKGVKKAYTPGYCINAPKGVKGAYTKRLKCNFKYKTGLTKKVNFYCENSKWLPTTGGVNLPQRAYFVSLGLGNDCPDCC